MTAVFSINNHNFEITANDEENIKKEVPDGYGYYILTDDIKKTLTTPPETWKLSGDPDGLGTGNTLNVYMPLSN